MIIFLVNHFKKKKERGKKGIQLWGCRKTDATRKQLSRDVHSNLAEPGKNLENACLAVFGAPESQISLADLI